MTQPKITADQIDDGITAGRHTLWIPAEVIRPRSSSPSASLATVAAGAGQSDLSTLDFDPTAVEYAQFSVAMPKSWDEGFVSAVFVWKHAAATMFDVVWGLQAVAFSNGNSAAVAFGGSQEVTDSGGTTNAIYQSPETADITIGNIPAENDWVVFQVYRNATAGADTLDVDAGLLGIKLFYATDADDDV